MVHGRYSEYAHKLESAEKAPYYVNESANYNPARRLHGGEERDFYVFGVSTARRLQGIVDEEPQFVAPAFEMDEIVDALQTVGEMFITLAPAIFDAFFGIANTAGSSSFSVIIEGFISLVKGVLGAMRWLIKSGLFTTIVNIGVEFLLLQSQRSHAIPLIFAAVDLLVCVLDLFKPSGWQVQFDCVEEECFAGPAATSDLLVFTSIPLALNVFVNILESTMNSNTAKRLFQPNKKLNAQGRTRNPDRNSNNEVLDTVPQDLPTNDNPVYEFDFADDFANFMPTTSNTGCAACFTCKVPEARAIWMLVVSIATLVSEGNFNTVRPPASAQNRPDCDSDHRHRQPHRKHQPEPPSGYGVEQRTQLPERERRLRHEPAQQHEHRVFPLRSLRATSPPRAKPTGPGTSWRAARAAPSCSRTANG